MKTMILGAAALAVVASTPVAAAEYNFSFDTVRTIFGGPFQTVRGIFTTSDTAVDRFGETAFAITGISGTINNEAITGLFDAPGNPTYYYFTTGPTFLDGSGVRFNTATAQNIALFHQDGVPADEYRLNGNGTISAFGPASSSPVAAAVPETATWAMMLVGFGGLGAVLRSRRKLPAATYA